MVNTFSDLVGNRRKYHGQISPHPTKSWELGVLGHNYFRKLILWAYVSTHALPHYRSRRLPPRKVALRPWAPSSIDEIHS